MITPSTPHDSRLLLVLIAASRADGAVSLLERVFIEDMMVSMSLPHDMQERYRRMLYGELPLPALTEGPLPTYPHRLDLFRKGLELAFSDGILHPGEKQTLDGLAETLELTPQDREAAWHQACEAVST